MTQLASWDSLWCRSAGAVLYSLKRALQCTDTSACSSTVYTQSLLLFVLLSRQLYNMSGERDQIAQEVGDPFRNCTPAHCSTTNWHKCSSTL